MMKLDILAIAAHPDDVELGCSGTLLKHIHSGSKAGVIDLTRGELGTRGNAEIRDAEAEAASRIMGLSARENMKFRDGFFQNDEFHQMELIKKIRFYQPEIVLANAFSDRHPDHPKGSQLITQSVFLSGLNKIVTEYQGQSQDPWRPKAVYHFIQSNYLKPDFVVDISDFWEKKMESIMAYGSQFHNPDSSEPETFISSSQFLEMVRARALDLGKSIGVRYAEGFNVERVPGVNGLFDLI